MSASRASSPSSKRKSRLRSRPPGTYIVAGIGQRAVEQRNCLCCKFKADVAVARHLHGMSEQAVTGNISTSVDGELLEEPRGGAIEAAHTGDSLF